ncbi:Uncharacterized membrane protein [Mycolicibacterium rutilum]|uniref:Uncharacterized membrane protein n=1 Tax=Mycolicibacterium rutilum TaxID=370526 RepID=A0A1H6JJV6_MYCRU|nr:anthrone oxygenase family protein [Mycolicibacterium rutilum]SEH60028.1 Uncharacterized membrane protein [Mycolicibacterium rutilum]
MNSNLFATVTSLAALAVAAAAGMMYVFSTFAMRGLDRTGPVSALTAMRGINTEANTNAAFLLAYFGAAVLAVVAGGFALTRLGQPGAVWVLVGAALALLAAVITVAFNVPLNNHLEGLDLTRLSADDMAREWSAYLSTWSAWNHARTAAGALGAVLMTVGVQLR